jgi:co-chaperonin GroES (HSP10)
MKWTPLADRVVIKSGAKDVSSGGIHLSGTMDKNKGTVVAVGSGVYDSRTGNTVPVSVSVGDEVILPQNGHYEDVELDGEKFVICREVDLLAFKVKEIDIHAINEALINTQGGIPEDPTFPPNHLRRDK